MDKAIHSDDDDEGEDKTIESMDSQEFLNSHNDDCDVCDEGGELLCCSTCTLVFHLECVRPTLEQLPEEEWSCPHCVISGVNVVVPGKTEKQVIRKNSKAWKEATVGIKEMEKLKRSKNKKGGGTNKTKDNNNSSSTRQRRARKQVALFDPQDCPASEWKSNMQTTKSKDDSDNDSTSSSELGDDEDDDSDTKWCQFCLDDKGIPICVFCGCRVCFGKHDKNKLLLCDKCDEEYHIYCLDPPLTSIPKESKKWFCPNCKPQPKSTAKKDSIADEMDASSERPRKRGRPAKATVSSPSPSLVEKDDTVSSRKRGRSPKNVTSKLTTSKKRDATSSFAETEGTLKRAKTIPSSTTSKTNDVIDKDNKVIVDPVKAAIKPSRSGRTQKRKSFHDEGEEGEQHLRSPGSKEAPEFVPKVVVPSTTKVTSITQTTTQEMTTKPKVVPQVKSQLAPAPAPMTKTATVPAVAPHHTINEKKINPLPEKKVAIKTAMTQKPISVVAQKAPTTNPPKPKVTTLPSVVKTVPSSVAASMQPTKVVSTTKTQIPVSGVGVATKSRPVQPPKPTRPAVTTSVQTKASLSEANKKQEKVLPSTFTNLKQPENVVIPIAPLEAAVKKVVAANPQLKFDVSALVSAAVKTATTTAQALKEEETKPAATPAKAPRRKPGARECMQISRRFGVRIIPKKYMDTLLDYCTRGKVEHLIRMRERLDEHSRYLEAQLAGLEALVQEKGEIDIIVPPLPERQENKPHHPSTPR